MRFPQSVEPSARSENTSPRPDIPGLGPSWNQEKQERYRINTSPQVFVHLLVDASLSMMEHRSQLVSALSRYEEWLKHFLHPVSQTQRWLFAGAVYAPQSMAPIRDVPALTLREYDPMGLLKHAGHLERYDGTHLYDALYGCLMQSHASGQHLLVMFTDGQDTGSDPVIVETCAEVLQHMSTDEGWLCCFLGTDMAAINVGLALGFTRGNCLYFAEDKFPEAFQKLQDATRRFLRAPETARKLLAQGGIF